jgi:hypothetical protein
MCYELQHINYIFNNLRPQGTTYVGTDDTCHSRVGPSPSSRDGQSHQSHTELAITSQHCHGDEMIHTKKVFFC